MPLIQCALWQKNISCLQYGSDSLEGQAIAAGPSAKLFHLCQAYRSFGMLAFVCPFVFTIIPKIMNVCLKKCYVSRSN